MKISGFIFLILLLGGCANGPTREDVIADVKSRSGFILPKQTEIGKITLPPGASLEDGLTEDEAVTIALWNNAAFQETLVNLDIARGDLIQAGMLPNPIGTYSLAMPDKPLKYALEFPLEALWLQPFRVDAAEAEAERVAQQLSQAGLTLIRDTRRAYSDMLQAKAQRDLLKESWNLRRHIAELSQKRLAAGDISKQETNVANLDALAAEQQMTRARYDIQTSEERLRFIMGVGSHKGALALDPAPVPECRVIATEALTEEALRTRPDALAAKQATAAARARSSLSLFGWLGITAIADATSGRDTGHELGPAVRGSVPVFNQNQGAVSRANAEEERALRNEETMAHQIRLDVNQASMQYRQACSELEILQTKVKAGVETDLSRVEKAYESGDVPYLMVLESSRAVMDTRLREAQLIGDVRRTLSELERSAGKRL